MVLLDTSFLIDILRNSQDAVELLDELERKEPNLFAASPTVMELWDGALQSKLPEKEKKRIDEMLFSVKVLPLDSAAAKRAAEIDFESSSKGMSVELRDVMIAGIAMVNGEGVVTRDSDYLRIAGLKVLKY